MIRNCSICGNSKKTLVYQQRFILPSDNLSLDYDVVVCSNCGFAYADNTPDQTILDKYYASMTKTSYELTQNIAALEQHTEAHEFEWDVKRHTQSVSNILPYLTSNSRVMDIGCGTGHILSLLKKNGILNIVGLDSSEVACKIAFERYGIHVFERSLFDDWEILDKYDFVILSHVLEHIEALPGFLYKLHALIDTGGYLYIEVPDAYNFSLSADPDLALCQVHARDMFVQFTPEHINFFTPVSLRNLMTRLGFQEVWLDEQISSSTAKLAMESWVKVWPNAVPVY